MFESSPASTAISVSALIAAVRDVVERAIPLQWVNGEISGFKRAASGHCYFDLKDAHSQVACVLYRNRAALIGFELKDGAQVELRVRPSIYEPRGSLQFSVEQARLAGVGRLYEAFLRLKAKLDAEGLFDDDLKRPLPFAPRTIGLITSTKAAALADMLRLLRDRWPRARVIVYPASVQGTNAPGELLAALQVANQRAECDVLIIGRGGGSMEDLWAFNDEALVRAVAASTLPIVSAVGHETDVTLCDFAADVRAPTPTAAAALVSPERAPLLATTQALAKRTQRALQRRIEQLGQRIDRIHERLRSSDRALAPWRERLLVNQHRLQRALHNLAQPRKNALLTLSQRYQFATREAQALRIARQRTHTLAERAQRAIHTQLLQRTQQLQNTQQALTLMNPQHVLDRGYAVIFNAQGQAVTDAAQIKIGTQITAQLKRGTLSAEIKDTQAEESAKLS